VASSILKLAGKKTVKVSGMSWLQGHQPKIIGIKNLTSDVSSQRHNSTASALCSCPRQTDHAACLISLAWRNSVGERMPSALWG
jgi:hypothetical protein